jgi:hypothetical protein
MTIVTSNLATKSSQKEQPQPTSLVALAKISYGNPKLQYLNAITIATNLAVTDTGATSILVMDGVDVENKRLATKPLTVNLPDIRKIKSTHVCDINIPGLPVILTGHIILDLKIASLIGIHPLCKVGCKVIFDNEKCDVVYKGNIILQGYIDPTTDLWIPPITKKRMQTTPSQNDSPQPCPGIGHAPHPPMAQQERALFLHSMQMRANNVKFAHQSLCNPKISTLLKATRRGFLKGCPYIIEKLIFKYLDPSPATAKGHMKRPRHGIPSTTPKTRNTLTPIVPVITFPAVPESVHSKETSVHNKPMPNNCSNKPHLIISEDKEESKANLFVFGAFADKNNGIVCHNLAGLFPFMSLDSSVRFFELYHYKSNCILTTPIAGLNDISIFNAYKKQFEEFAAKGFKLKLNVMDNQATKHIKQNSH